MYVSLNPNAVRAAQIATLNVSVDESVMADLYKRAKPNEACWNLLFDLKKSLRSGESESGTMTHKDKKLGLSAEAGGYRIFKL